MRELGKVCEPEELIEHFAHLIGKGREDICKRGKRSIERAMLMELLYRFCQITQPEIGRLVGGIDYSAVSQARKRLRVRLESEAKLKRRFDSFTSCGRISNDKIYLFYPLYAHIFMQFSDVCLCRKKNRSRNISK